jgi:hypothetical protein
MFEFFSKLFDVFFGAWREKRELKRQFDALRRDVLYCGITNDIPVKLHKLRKFMIEHGAVESSPSCREFFATWLMHPMVVQGIPALGSFTYDEIQKIQRDLTELAL